VHFYHCNLAHLYAKDKGNLYLNGIGVLPTDVQDCNDKNALYNHLEERKAREEIWERYTTRTMSTAMKAAYAELYPDIYGKNAPDTKELINVIDPYAAFDDTKDDHFEYQHKKIVDSDKCSEIGLGDDQYAENDSCFPRRIHGNDDIYDDSAYNDDIDDREKIMEMENKKLEKKCCDSFNSFSFN
jgi:hypothetical protein